MTIVVLGAGATRGAEFAGQNMLCQPPLNADFFTQIQRIFDDKYKKDIDATIYNTCKIFGTNFNLTMEDLFTQIEFMLRAFEFVKVGQKRLETINDLRKLRESLFQSIFAVLERSVHKILQKDKMECRYHGNLVKALSKDDTIISFNYDCLIDIMLRKYGGEKWGPNWGYCFPGRNYQRLRFEKWENEGKVKATKDSTIKLLKVHGSINWDITEPKKDN